MASDRDKIILFSSHAWAYLHRRDGLHELLAPDWEKERDFFDLSVTPRHPLDTQTDRELADQLCDRIALCDVVLVMAGMYAHDREWMEFEIHAAVALKRPIIPVVFNGQQRVPQTATRFASCEPVRWRGDSVREAILSFLPYEQRLAFEMRRVRERAALLDIIDSVFGQPLQAPHRVETNSLLPPRGLAAYSNAMLIDFPFEPVEEPINAFHTASRSPTDLDLLDLYSDLGPPDDPPENFLLRYRK